MPSNINKPPSRPSTPSTASCSSSVPNSVPTTVSPKLESTEYIDEKSVYVVNLAHDDRPYCDVRIYDMVKSGLLDSGSSVTVIATCPEVQDLVSKAKPPTVSLKVANGGFLVVLGCVPLPIQYLSKTVTINTIVVQELAHELILGVDFWHAIGLRIVDEKGVTVNAIDEKLSDRIETEVELQQRDQVELRQVVDQFLVTSGTSLTKTPLIEHVIELKPDSKPFVLRPHLYSPHVEDKMKIELDRMINLGVIEPSNSPVASPIVPVTKRDGSVRLCLDSRRLNTLTVRDQFPVPNTNHIFARMRKSVYISTIDLAQAFWQINLSSQKLPGQFASSRELTAFVFPGRGLFHFQRMPFGLTNSPATMCRLMYRVLGHDLEPFVFVYIDDILILATSVAHMLRLLREVGKRLSAANLSVNLKKCNFFAKETKYLGYIISSEGMRADPDKLATMVNYPVPKSVREVRRFLGLTGYYRRLINDYSGIAAPLTNLLRKTFGPFRWTKEADDAFNALRTAMCTSPVVGSPDFSLEFCIQCDASDISAAAVLTQTQDGKEIIISYFSHKWSATEKNWAATEKESASVIKAIDHFRGYIYGRPFTVITDAKALTHVKSIRTDGSSRLSRWALELNQHAMNIKHRAGKLSVVPDALSRIVNAISSQESESVSDDWLEMMKQKLEESPEQYPDFKLEGGRLFKYEMMKDDIGLNSYRWKEYVPLPHRIPLVKKLHERLCHLGPTKCFSVAKREYFWPGMLATLQQEVRRCETCKACKPRNQHNHVPMGMSRTADLPFKRIALDHFGPTLRSRKGNRWLLVVVDIHTKFVLLHPCRTGKAAEVVKFLEEEVFLKFGVPAVVLSDNARALVGRSMVRLLEAYNVSHWTTAYYHAQGNPAERYIRTVSAAIRSVVFERDGDQRAWDVNIPQIQLALNTTNNETTGKSPFFANFGRQHIMSGDEYQQIHVGENRNEMTNDQIRQRFEAIRQEIEDAVNRAVNKRVERYNQNTKPVQFVINERVWRNNTTLSDARNEFSSKLAPKFIPCKVVRTVGQDTYIVQDEIGSTRTKVHANDLHKDRH